MSKNSDKMKSKEYKKALVIFIDILGSQSRNDFNELLEINELFHDEMINNQEQDREYVAYQRHIYTFSDCAYIFYSYKDNIDKSYNNLGSLFEVALYNCEPLLMKFLSRGLVFRGGVSYGNVYYDENRSMFFGEAVNRAFLYESKIAKYPRIILEKFVVETISNYNKQEKFIAKLDSDNQYYFHFLNSIQQGKDYSLIIDKGNKEFISYVISMCDTNIEKFSENNNIRSKYEWLKKYVIQSKNDIVGESIVYQKPFWDSMFDKLSKKMIRTMLTEPDFLLWNLKNVDVPADKIQFEKYTESIIDSMEKYLK